jgi:hypothetical protein
MTDSLWRRIVSGIAALALAAGLACAAASAQQFPPVPPAAAGRSALPAQPLGGAELLTELRKGGCHGKPFYATAGAPYLGEGEAAVIRALKKDFEIVARVRHDAWRALAARDP